MNFDQADTGIIVLLAILGISILIAVIVIAKTITNEAKEKKEKSAQLAADRLTEEKNRPHDPQTSTPAPAPAKPATKPVAKAHKDDVSEDDDLIAAAEVYLTYELKEQAITSLEKHLLTNPTDKKALALLKKAEASD